jgi:hypothetical protein
MSNLAIDLVTISGEAFVLGLGCIRICAIALFCVAYGVVTGIIGIRTVTPTANYAVFFGVLIFSTIYVCACINYIVPSPEKEAERQRANKRMK